MRDRKIYLGPFNNGNKEILKDKAYSYLEQNKGDRFYYILPNSQLLKKYRREFIKEVGSAFELNLYTFDDVVNQIVEGDFRKTVNDPMKGLIIRKVLKKLDQRHELEYYKDFTEMNGFIKSCIEIIREIKRSLILPEDYLKRCPKDKFYSEIGLIYKEYEKEMDSNYLTDRENDYLKCLKILDEKNSYMKNLDFVIIDEFYDFRPVELEIIKELSKKDIDLYINMPFGDVINNRILKKTLDILKDMDFQSEIVSKDSKNVFETLAERLFSNSDEKLDFIDRIELIKSPSAYLELKKLFREIKKNLLQGINMEDMGLVLLNNSYLKSLERVAMEEEIPIKSGNARQLMELAMIKEFCNLIKTRISTSKANILNRVKSIYFPICSMENKEEMEYILRKLDFNDLDKLEEILKGNMEISISERCLPLLFQIIDLLKEEINSIPREGDVKAYNEYFLSLLDKYHIEGLVVERFRGDEEVFNRDLNTLEMLRAILHKIDEIALIQDYMTIEDYFLVLEDYLSNESILESDLNLNGLQVLSPINIRGLSFKKIFIPGLSQEEYPRLDNSNFFLKDDNCGVLKSMGIDLKDYHERFSNEALKFSTIISSCSENLYLSYNENSLEEGKNIPSMFIDEILSRINGDKMEEKLRLVNLEVDYLIGSNIEDSTCEKDFSTSLLYKYYRNELEEKYIEFHEEKYPEKLEKINSMAKLALMRSSGEFNSYSGKLSYEGIKDIIKDDLAQNVYSISYLEAYSKCPYYFLLNKYFNVEEMGREVERYSPLDVGSIYHYVLNDYYRKYKLSMENISELNVEETLESLKSLVYKYATMEGFKKEDEKDLLLIENIYLRLFGLIKSDMDRLKKSDGILPWEFEVEFGKDEDFEIEYNEKKVRLRGIIDRIDRLKGNKFMVLDYKSSSFGKQDITRIAEGLSLQLPVYIMSQKEKNIVAGSYLTISDGDFFVSMGILGEADFITKRQKGAVDTIQWDELLTSTKVKIIEIVELIHQGDFSINPKDCSPYCLYKDICRYEKVLEVE